MKLFIWIYGLFVIALLAPVRLVAQTGTGLYGLRTVLQSSYYNPAFYPRETSFVTGIPIISGFSGRLYNTAFSFDELFDKNNEYDSLFLDLTSIIHKKQGLNRTDVSLEHDLLMIGFRAKKSFLTFGVSQRIKGTAFYTDDLLKLLWEGNDAGTNRNLDLSQSQINEMHLLDYHFGLAIPTGDAVTLGLRFHLLQGLSDISFERSNVRLYTLTDPDNVYSLQANTDFLVHTSGTGFLYDSVSQDVGSYFLNFNNSGFSFDAGIDARISDNLNLSVAILDLGSVTWRKGNKSYRSNVDHVDFSGMEFDILHDSSLFEKFRDTLENLLQVQTDTLEYSTSLAPRIFVGTEYFSFDEKNNLSLVFCGRFEKTGFQPALGIGYTGKVSEHFSYKLNYTYLRYSPLTFGAGLTADFKPFQFYIMADNLFQFVMPKKQHFFYLAFGLNIKIPGHSRELPETFSVPLPAEHKTLIPDIVDF